MPLLTPSMFDALAITGQERIHSQVLCGILDPDMAVVPTEQAALFLYRLCFGKKEAEALLLGGSDRIRAVTTEYNHMDLVVLTERRRLFVIENKLKSTQGFQQLSRYDQDIEKAKNEISKWDDGQPLQMHKVYLSLVAESMKSAPSDWKPVSYNNLSEELDALRRRTNSNNPIFEHYLNSLYYLLSVSKEFLANHNDFPNVFTDGGLKKAEKFHSRIKPDLPVRRAPRNDQDKYKATLPHSTLNEKQRYIRANQLETVLQRAFLASMVDFEDERLLDLWESHGLAMVQFQLANVVYSDHWIRLGMQVQGESIKYNLHLFKGKYPSTKEANRKGDFKGKYSTYHKALEASIPWTKEERRINESHKSEKDGGDYAKCYLSYSRKKRLDQFSPGRTKELVWKEIVEELSQCDKAADRFLVEIPKPDMLMRFTKTILPHKLPS